MIRGTGMPGRLGHKGVTLIELLIVMGIMTLVIAASSRLLTSMLTQFKQQSKIAETSIESLVGLEVMRRDLFGTGFGLPQTFQNNSLMSYSEAQSTLSPAKLFNDATSTTSSPPRAIIANTLGGATKNGSYYMVIKSLLVADDPDAGKYNFLFVGDSTNTWDPDSENLHDDDKILIFFVDDDDKFSLAMDSSQWRPGGIGTGKGTFTSGNMLNYAPSDEYTVKLVYGVSKNTSLSALRFPFNRADYYISDGSAPYSSDTVTPSRCAHGTGVLVKAILKNDNDSSAHGGTFDYNDDNKPEEMPLLDCVLDFQVGVNLDTDDDGVPDTLADPASLDSKSAETIRKEVKEIRVYVLAHEGQFDPDFEYPSQNVYLGDTGATGHTVDIAARVGDDSWSHFRWKIYSMVVQPQSLNNALSSTE